MVRYVGTKKRYIEKYSITAAHVTIQEITISADKWLNNKSYI